MIPSTSTPGCIRTPKLLHDSEYLAKRLKQNHIKERIVFPLSIQELLERPYALCLVFRNGQHFAGFVIGINIPDPSFSKKVQTSMPVEEPETFAICN